MKILENNTLMKVHVAYYDNFWTLRPEVTRRGEQIQEREIRFRGGLEDCTFALQLLNAKDADIAPAGRLRRPYPALAKDLMEGFSKYIWVTINDWKKVYKYI